MALSLAGPRPWAASLYEHGIRLTLGPCRNVVQAVCLSSGFSLILT